MSRNIEGIRDGDKPGLTPWSLLGKTEDSAHGTEIPGADVWYRAGRHARQTTIANDFKYCGRRGGTGGFVIWMQAKEAHLGFGWEEGERYLVFYADAGWIKERDPVLFQKELAVTVQMFGRIRLETNLEKKKSMVYTPGLR